MHPNRVARVLKHSKRTYPIYLLCVASAVSLYFAYIAVNDTAIACTQLTHFDTPSSLSILTRVFEGDNGRDWGLQKYVSNLRVPFPVYYINMDKSLARRRRMELGFGGMWDLRRSPAIDGANRTLVLQLMGRENYDRIAKYVTEDRSPDTINTAELGCILSHLATIRRAYIEGHSIAMIVEDDITPLLVPFWTSPISRLIQEADSDHDPWGLIQLAWIWGLDGGLYYDIEARSGPGHQLVRIRFQFGTSAYIISKAGMEQVLRSFFSADGRIRLEEGGRQAELYVSTASNVLVAVPSLFTIEGSDTTISTGEEEQRRLSSHRESNNVHVKATLDLFYTRIREQKTREDPN